MKSRLFVLFSFVILFAFPCFSYASVVEKLLFSRPDGSLLTCYVTVPDNTADYPVAFILHGSQCESVKSWHEDFQPVALNVRAALVTLEKQGIYSPHEMDDVEYDQTNSFDHRLEDHLWIIEKLRQGEIVSHWNGRIIMIGGSEGGRVSAAISAVTPEVKATVLFTCGGGLSTADELTISFAKHLTSHGDSDEEISEALGLLQLQIQQMKLDPTPDKKFLNCTYKWWASHLNHNLLSDLMQLNHPIYYVHGTADEVIPIESADRLAALFQEAGKKDFHYNRLENYGHDMRTFPPETIELMIKMLEENQALFPEVTAS